MKIGYPCINWTIGCKGNRTFRLKSYNQERLIETVKNNLSCLKKIIEYNIKNGIFFFRITSDLVPFASHPICTFNWQEYFKRDFFEIGRLISKNKIRISMHPDQFIVINSPKKNVIKRSIAELIYHAQVLDLMKLDSTAKIQLHIGGAYDNKKESMNRFKKTYEKLDQIIKKRLVIENDHRIFSFNDCYNLHQKIKIPILLDFFHHLILNQGEKIQMILDKFTSTWDELDGTPMLDYSSQKPNAKIGNHAEEINEKDFQDFLEKTKPFNFDIMLEIKDKEKSAIKALKIIKNDKRYRNK